MTREEAITVLKDISWQMGSVKRWENIEAIDIAIEALSADAEPYKVVAEVKVDTEEILKRIKEEYVFKDEVVRCKDCKHLKTMCEDEGTCYYWCKHWNNATDDWGHCYYGERREP